MYRISNIPHDKEHIDWFTVVMYLLFVVLGWFNIYAASFDLETSVSMFDISGRAGMQLVWIGVSLVVIFTILKLDISFFENNAFLFYLIGIGVLVLTYFVAPDIKGSRSWLVIGSFRLQPAEFMKFVNVLMLSKIFSIYNFKLMEPKNILMVSAVILLPTILVIMQSETGTALVYLSLIFVLYREGLPGGFLFMGVAFIIYFVLTIKFSGTELGVLSLGEIYTVGLIIFFAALLVKNYMKRNDVPIIMISIGLIISGIGVVMSRLGIDVNVGLLALIGLGTISLSFVSIVEI